MASQLTHIGVHTLVEFDKLCRQLVREMAEKIRKETATAQIIPKPGYDGVTNNDVVTTADLAARITLRHSSKGYSPLNWG